MHLKRLEVFGFKSFAEKTILEFQPGIAAIVGPNGCGKSNVFDAIRWVLGEQSVKDLRGSSMEDVIFNGTDKRVALGFAEVSLVFSNEDRVLAPSSEEVTVTRRLFRSGESEYLINKTPCRLRDIVEMFMGTGVGAEAYSLVQQGRVDLVVSAKPDDRRQIFDEAAGITKYKSKKKEALSKLKETEDNLLRINDIVVEVKRQISTIERQAKKAQKYKEDFEQLKNFEMVMATYAMGQFQHTLQEFSHEVARLQHAEQENLKQLEDVTQRMNHEQEMMGYLDEQINELRTGQVRLDNEVAIHQQQVEFNLEKITAFSAQRARLEEDKKAAMDRCQASQVKIDEIQQSLNDMRESLEQSSQVLLDKRTQLQVLLNAIDESQNAIHQIHQEIMSLNAQEVRIKNQLTDILKRMTENSARKARLEQENSKVTTERHQVGEKFNAISGALEQTQAGLESLWATLNAQRSQLEEFKLREHNQEEIIHKLERTHVFLMSQKEFIEKMQVQYQDIPDPVVEGKFVSSVRPSDNQTGIIGKIKAINVIPATETSPELYEIIYETKYIELDLAHMDDRIAQLEGQIHEAIQARGALEREIHIAHGTIDGTLRQIQDQEKKMSVLESQKSDIELETGKISGELDMLVSEFAQVESDLAQLKVEEDNLSVQLKGITSQIVQCQDHVKAKQAAITDKVSLRESLQVAIAQAQGDVDSFAQKELGLKENLSVYSQSLDRDLGDIARCEREANETTSKEVELAEQNVRLGQEILKTKESQEGIARQLEHFMEQKTEMTQRMTVLRSQTRAIEDEIIAAKTELHHIQMKEQEVQFNQRALKERLLQAYKIDWEELQKPPVEPLMESPLEPKENVEEQQGAEPAAVVAEDIAGGAHEQGSLTQPVDPQDVQAPQPQVNYEELALEIDRLKKRCESYGVVNLVAIEEFDELKNRHEYLSKQQSDLLTAREQLLSTIQKINRTTRHMFTETFTKVNEEFQVYFRQLFGGGEAQLILLDPENALECGIDIVARPPGKKPQSISLLSGGEKTLTAIGLIFAVFKVNPSPFCVLDEIDAALDESNVGRFATMLKDFAKIAQFVVITHNKRTMQVADMMYGVTMQERGVSRIVSVKFNEFTPPSSNLPTPAPAQAQLAAV